VVGSWVVGAVIRFQSNGSAVMSRLASSTASANLALQKQNGQISAAEAQMARYRLQTERAIESRRRFLTMGSLVAAGIGVGVMADAVSDAAKLQTQLIGVRNATGATQRQMEGLRQTIYNTGDAIGQNVVKTAELYAIIARSSGGVFKTKNGGFDMAAFNKIAPGVADVAMIQNRTRGVSLDEGAKTTMQLVHLMREYSGEGFDKIADGITRLSEMMPDSLTTALKQMTYFEPGFKTLHISNQDAFATMALLDRMGYGRGKGGTNLADLIQAAIPALQMTKHAQVGKQDELRRMGLIDNTGRSVFFRDNRGNLFGFLQQLEKFAHGKPSDEIMSLFKGVFGTQGARIANLALDPKFLQQLPGIESVMQNKNLSLNEQVKQYQGSLGFQFGRSVANLQSVMTELGWPWLKDLTNFFQSLGNNLHGFQQWLHSHKGEEKAIGGVFAWVTGVAATLGVIGSVGTVTSIMGTAGAINRLTLSIDRLGTNAALAGGEVATAGTEARAASLGLGMLAAPLAALFGYYMLMKHAVDEGQRRMRNGTNATQNQQYRRVARSYVDKYGTLHMPNGTSVDVNGNVRSPATSFNLPPPRLGGPRSGNGDVHVASITINIDGSGDPKATGAAVASALHPMSLLRTAGVNRSTPSLPFAFGMNGVK
jgi:TP901 family phage tail tape measure protein